MAIKAKQIPGLIEGLCVLAELHKVDVKMTSWNGILDGNEYKTWATEADQLAIFKRKVFLDCASAFANWTTLKTIPRLNKILGTTVANMFMGCTSLKELDDIQAPYAIDANGFASGCTSLEKVSNLDLSSATNVSKLFYGAAKLKDISGMKLSKILNGVSMFEGCTSLEEVSNLDLSSVANVSKLFYGAAKLKSISGMQFGKILNAVSMFEGCTSLPTDINTVFDISSVTDLANIKNMFQASGVRTARIRCAKSNPIRNTITIKDLSLDGSITKIILLDENDIEEIIDITTRLKDLDMSSWVITKKCMFENTDYTKLKTADELAPLATYAFSNMKDAFYGGTGVDAGFISFPPKFYTSKCQDFSHAFAGNKQLTKLPDMDTSNGVNMASMMEDCAGLTIAPEYNTSNATNMSKMYKGIPLLTAISKIDTSKAIDVTQLFAGDTALTSIPILNLAAAQSMQGMFMGCAALTNVNDLTPIGTNANGFDMSDLFNGCAKLAAVPKIEFGKANNIMRAFKGCNSLPVDFPYVVDLTGITDPNNVIDFLEGSSVKTITIKCTNDSVKAVLAKNVIGSQLTKITIVDENDKVVETRDASFVCIPQATSVQWTTPGTYDYVIPAGVTAMKLGALSSHTINLRGNISDFSTSLIVSSSCQPSSFGDLLVSPIDNKIAEARQGYSAPFDITGYSCNFDAVVGTGNYDQGATCPVTCVKNHFYGYARATGNSYAQKIVSVTPGDRVKVTVSRSSITTGWTINETPVTGTTNGFVIMNYGPDIKVEDVPAV